MRLKGDHTNTGTVTHRLGMIADEAAFVLKRMC